MGKFLIKRVLLILIKLSGIFNFFSNFFLKLKVVLFEKIKKINELLWVSFRFFLKKNIKNIKNFNRMYYKLSKLTKNIIKVSSFLLLLKLKKQKKKNINNLLNFFFFHFKNLK